MPSDLRFPAHHEVRGFSTHAMAQHAGNPEPIVRELLQNGLDAAKEAGRGTPEDPAEIVFVISKRPTDDLPGLAAYVNAFRAAEELRRERQKENLSPDEKQVIERIKNVLGAEQTRFLFCRDNGIGLDDMERVLSEGNSSKGSSGGGSFGLGHMTAFAASDLRYVLYAARTRRGEIAGGHAVLASSRSKNGKTYQSPDGYYTREVDLLSSLDSSRYQADTPVLLQQQLDEVEPTGSVVCITGFNNFRDDADPVAAICRVSAINFLAAIERGELIVRVQDEVAGIERRVDWNGLGDILTQAASQQKASVGGWLAGVRAFRAWETLRANRLLPTRFGEGVEVYFRELPMDRADRSQVNLFRDGMWITYSAPGLGTSAFAGVRPFDAVLSLSGGELYDLVRKAEPPEHRGLETQRLEASEKKNLAGRLGEVANLLRDAAGQLDEKKEYTPPGFAMLDSASYKEADALPRYRPIQSEGRERTTHRGAGDEPEEHEHNNGRRRRGGARPAPGSSVRVRSAIRPESNSAGQIHALTVVYEPGRGERAGNLAVRIRVASGSDETCDQPFRPEWLRIASIEYDGATQPVQGDGWEAPLPNRPTPVKINLSRPITDSAGVEIDVVRRRPKESSA